MDICFQPSVDTAHLAFGDTHGLGAVREEPGLSHLDVFRHGADVSSFQQCAVPRGPDPHDNRAIEAVFVSMRTGFPFRVAGPS